MTQSPIHSHFSQLLVRSKNLLATKSIESIQIEDVQKMIDGFYAFQLLQLEQSVEHRQQMDEYFQEMLKLLDQLEARSKWKQQFPIDALSFG